jgi:signal peptidase
VSRLRLLLEFLQPIAAVALVGALLFAATGIWPPMVAVESGSMQPTLERGDLVVVSEPARYGPDSDDGIVTARGADGFRSLGGPGNVVVYMPPGRSGSPIIHRARFHVEKGENWYDRANEDWLAGAENCEQLPNCPAPNAGYVTKGDANSYYDQARETAPPVNAEWVRGEAQLHVPWLGELRLFVAEYL